MTRLILIRHGETSWTREKRFQGHSNTVLSLVGKRQAKALAKEIKKYSPDVLYASDLKRASETAAIIGRSAKLRPRKDRRIREMNFGLWEGKTGKQLAGEGSKIYRDWCRGRQVSPPKGESFKRISFRTNIFLDEILRKYDGKTIAVVSHGGAIKIMISRALKLPLRSLWSFRLDPASISVIHVYPDFMQVVSLNHTAHLRRGKTA